MEPSIFTRIIRGEIPSHKVYEDDLTLAFLDIRPIQYGQVLVIPKQQVDNLWDLDYVTYQAVMSTVYKVSARLKEYFKGKRIGLIVEGLEVPHAHVKVFPFTNDEEFRTIPQAANAPTLDQLKKLASDLTI